MRRASGYISAFRPSTKNVARTPPRGKQVEQAREYFDDGEVLPDGHVRRPHAQLELGRLAEVVERHRHGWPGHGASIVQGSRQFGRVSVGDSVCPPVLNGDTVALLGPRAADRYKPETLRAALEGPDHLGRDAQDIPLAQLDDLVV